MTSLSRDLRKDLEKTVKQARRVAEAGARQAVQQLRVGDGDAPKDLTTDQRALRTRLRAHGRQLGDRRDANTGAQETGHLVQECAYEHWHRMLFARFLAETDLLIEPESGVAITLDEVQELAREKAIDWLPLASEYAEQMLPQIFRKDDPVLQIMLPPERRSQMEDLLKGLSKPVFEADDSLGWVYQFWQADKKEEVNKSETKIGAEELPAVTQLFTEDYMVLFLLHNTLGAWWAGKVLANNPGLATSAADEAALRVACKVGDIDWSYLRFVREKDEGAVEGPWSPAAGIFQGWPISARGITVLDPCMGSGHFLVFALPILVAFRMVEEKLTQIAATDAVLRENLFGLEIDPRCTQIAAFNLAFAAWRKVGFRPLPQVNLACSGLVIGVSKAEWVKLAEKVVTAADPLAKRDLLGVEQNLLTVGLETRARNGLESLYDLFAKAPWLGSLIEPRNAGGDIFREGFDKLEPMLASILHGPETDEAREIAVTAQGMAKAAEILSSKFTLVTTNVPYLGRLKQNELLRDHCEKTYPESKADLATCFIERCLGFLANSGSTALVTPQNWLFLGSFKKLRTSLLKARSWKAVVQLGEEAWWTFGMRGPRTVLLVLSEASPNPTNSFMGIDVSTNRAQRPILLEEKALRLSDNLASTTKQVSQQAQWHNPDTTIIFEPASNITLLSEYADSVQGASTLDIERFRVSFWEILIGSEWVLHQSTPAPDGIYSGLQFASIHRRPGGQFDQLADDLKMEGRLGGAWSGQPVWGKQGIACSWMGKLPVAIYLGAVYDNSIAAIIPKNPAHLDAIWSFCSSSSFLQEVRKINHKPQVANATLVKVPFDLAYWTSVAAAKYPNGLPKPSSNDLTQWLFTGHPRDSAQPLQAAVARMLGYRWPRQTGANLPDCPALESDGLENSADRDGIACISATKGEPSAERRLNELLASAYGSDWSAAKLAGLLSDADFAGKTLDDWLKDGFFRQHCELFHQRPFIWHIWDGRRDGFHALVNSHRLAASDGEGRRILEKLIYSYLGDWIDRQRSDQAASIEGADGRLAAAEQLRVELNKILDGHPPYDIFVRWKPLHEQPIGWEPDINDGVRVNIRPFMTARSLGGWGANACVLRVLPKIKWDKDRGKEPSREKADYPWFWSWDEASQDFAGGKEFDGNRWVDLHYSHAVKQAARDRRLLQAGRKP